MECVETLVSDTCFLRSYTRRQQCLRAHVSMPRCNSQQKTGSTVHWCTVRSAPKIVRIYSFRRLILHYFLYEYIAQVIELILTALNHLRSKSTSPPCIMSMIHSFGHCGNEYTKETAFVPLSSFRAESRTVYTQLRNNSLFSFIAFCYTHQQVAYPSCTSLWSDSEKNRGQEGEAPG